MSSFSSSPPQLVALANNRRATAAAAAHSLDAHDELEVLWHVIDGSQNDEDVGDEDQAIDMDADTSGEFARLLGMSPTGTQSPASCLSSSSTTSSPSVTASVAAKTTGAPPKRKPRKFTPEQVVMRRKRNRDSMRRVRQRKQVEVEHLRQQMEMLEDKLDELRVVRDQTGTAAPLAATTPGDEDASSHSSTTRPRRSKAEMQELLEGIKALQVEQMYLHNAILNHQQISASLMQIINESDSLMFRPAVTEPASSGLFQDNDEFQWVNAVLPLLPPLTRACVYDLVRESYLDIVNHIKLADAQLDSPNQVLGWSDRRAVNGTWADFLFSKEFAHEEIDLLAAKTWRVLTHMDQSNGFQSKSLKLKVLDKLNDDTLVMARSTYSPLERKYYNSIYVLLRVETADGYVFGGRTVCPLPEYEDRMREALGDDRAYSHMFYGLIFSRVEDPSASIMSLQSRGCDLVESGSPHASPSSSPSPAGPDSRFADRGVRVKYGGRVGNGSPLMAQAWAMDVLLAALRWENSCVKPLKLLGV